MVRHLSEVELWPSPGLQEHVMVQRRTRKRWVVPVAIVVLLVGGGRLGYAWFTPTGEGVGAAGTGSPVDFDVTSDAAVGGPLTPAGTAQTVDFTVGNPSTGHQKLTLVTVAVAEPGNVAWDDVPGCTAADYSVSVTTPPAYGDMAPSATLTGTATIAMVNRNGDQDPCAGAAVPLYFSAS
jgi:hypothetical protein